MSYATGGGGSFFFEYTYFINMVHFFGSVKGGGRPSVPFGGERKGKGVNLGN